MKNNDLWPPLIFLWGALFFYFAGIAYGFYNEEKKKKIRESEDPSSLISCWNSFTLTMSPVLLMNFMAIFAFGFMAVVFFIFILSDLHTNINFIFIAAIYVSNLILQLLFISLLKDIKIKYDKGKLIKSRWLPLLIFLFDSIPNYVWKIPIIIIIVLHMTLLIKLLS